jgi:hypothetical protein
MPSKRVSDSERIRALIDELGLSQRAAAGELDLGERTIRYYCSGGYEVPRVVFLALERLIDIQRAGDRGGN